MRWENLSSETIGKIKAYHLDHIVEKHEGWGWDFELPHVAPELLDNVYVTFVFHECGFLEEVVNGGLPASATADR